MHKQCLENQEHLMIQQLIKPVLATISKWSICFLYDIISLTSLQTDFGPDVFTLLHCLRHSVCTALLKIRYAIFDGMFDFFVLLHDGVGSSFSCQTEGHTFSSKTVSYREVFCLRRAKSYRVNLAQLFFCLFD